ncbi:MAG: hypothetical protein Alpg2KO_12610 [Alphaproteobacteria bacterium]
MRLVVRITTAPTDGKANNAVIALLAKQVGLPRSAFHLHSGATSRRKCLTVNAPMAELMRALLT